METRVIRYVSARWWAKKFFFRASQLGRFGADGGSNTAWQQNREKNARKKIFQIQDAPTHELPLMRNYFFNAFLLGAMTMALVVRLVPYWFDDLSAPSLFSSCEIITHLRWDSKQTAELNRKDKTHLCPTCVFFCFCFCFYLSYTWFLSRFSAASRITRKQIPIFGHSRPATTAMKYF